MKLLATARVVVPLAIVIAVGLALADDNARRGILSQIASKLDSAAYELASLERKSDASDVDDALNYVYQVERLLEDLRRVPGSDSEADKILSSYPGYIKDFRAAAAELKNLKLRQPKAGEYLRQCEAFEKEMTAKAQATKDDPRGAEELSAFAKAVGRKGEDLMTEASRMATEVERSRSAARYFSASDDRWNNIRSNVHNSADAVARDWTDNYERARRACAEVVKRERHHEVERALGRVASSRAGRKQLRGKIDELLALIATRIYQVERQSDTSYVNGAIEITKEIDSQLERLRVAAGDDTEIQTIASRWPARMRELRESLVPLRDMKFNQNRADDGERKCQEAEQALAEKIRRYVGDPTQHEQAIRELPDEADRIGTPIRTGIEKADQVDRQMDGWLRTARSFSYSEPGYSAITSNSRDSADSVYAHWRGHFDRMKRACMRLVLGKAHPDVVRAIEEMSRDTKSAGDSYRALRSEFNAWKAEVDKLREFTAKDVEEIRLEFCAATDHDEVLSSVNAIADRWAVQLRSLYGTITGTADRIKRSADDLIAKKRALKAAPKTKRAVDAVLATIAKLRDGSPSLLDGSNNPLLKAQAQYGTDMHVSMQKSCDASEITISSSYCDNPNPKRNDCKLDCVRGCTIVEIKPDNSAAENLGQRQVDAYRKGLVAMFRARGADMFQGKFELFRKCMSSDQKRLVLETKVEPYKFCPSADQLAPPLQRVDPSLPSEAE